MHPLELHLGRDQSDNVKSRFQITFWGVRGSLPVPGPQTVEFGGNTACVQVQVGQRLLIMDSGTGIFKLGQHLLQKEQPISADIFVTHTHWDHIQGFPFFGPAFIKGNHFTLYGPAGTDLSFARLMKGQMMYEYFPIGLEHMGAQIDFCELLGGEILHLGDNIKVGSCRNNHPGGALSYRLDYQGRSCCYVTDTEHHSPIDEKLQEFIKGADLVIYDSNFTDLEYCGYRSYLPKRGWGHSTWQEGIKLVKAAQAKTLVFFHHASFRTDKDLKLIEKEAQGSYANCLMAREGLVITL